MNREQTKKLLAEYERRIKVKQHFVDDDDQTLPYLCAGENGIYWLNRNEFEIIEQ